MYWLNVQGLRVKAFVVCCVLFVVCCLLFVVSYCVFVRELERQVKQIFGACLFVGLFVCLCRNKIPTTFWGHNREYGQK